MPAIDSYYQIYKNLGLLDVKISLEFLKLNILLIIYVMQLRSGDDPRLQGTLKNASYRGGRAAK